MDKVEELRRAKYQAFIEARTQNANEINRYMTEINKLDRAMFEGITFPNGNTAEEIAPAMFAENFDAEEIERQLQAFQDFADKVGVVLAAKNTEALRILKEEI